MKLKSLFVVLCCALSFGSFANNIHKHSKAQTEQAQAKPKNMLPGYCQIEIINQSYRPVYIYGQFDDGYELSFTVYPYEPYHYIDLYYDGYCHSGMFLEASNDYGVFYAAYTGVNKTLRFVPFSNNQAKAIVSGK